MRQTNLSRSSSTGKALAPSGPSASAAASRGFPAACSTAQYSVTSSPDVRRPSSASLPSIRSHSVNDMAAPEAFQLQKVATMFHSTKRNALVASSPASCFSRVACLEAFWNSPNRKYVWKSSVSALNTSGGRGGLWLADMYSSAWSSSADWPAMSSACRSSRTTKSASPGRIRGTMLANCASASSSSPSCCRAMPRYVFTCSWFGSFFRVASHVFTTALKFFCSKKASWIGCRRLRSAASAA